VTARGERRVLLVGGSSDIAVAIAWACERSGGFELVVRPGFVRTRMTAGLPQAPFATTAQAVAEAVVRALDGRAPTIWVPARLRWVFVVLRHLPRWLYRRLPL
jgi:decaprenylphospho-beta-D-erythro-pentofuranosid-2-ulose 2-reductase